MNEIIGVSCVVCGAYPCGGTCIHCQMEQAEPTTPEVEGKWWEGTPEPYEVRELETMEVSQCAHGLYNCTCRDELEW